METFNDKIESVRSSTASAPPPTDAVYGGASTFDEFEQIDASYIERLVRDAPNKNCALDPVPTWLVKQFVVELSPFQSTLFNASMRFGSFPTSQKTAIVVPALKKPSLDPLDMTNYRPISNLSFVSKLLER